MHWKDGFAVKYSVEHALQQLPWAISWTKLQLMAHGSMRTELYAPRGTDPQQPHAQDELYFIQRGSGEFVQGNARCRFAAGDAFFVPAGQHHRFENFSDDFATWVVFWGPSGGERE
jgi:mannose-6-phosphate isomerase-like protein (cupin superfamily)